VSELVGLIDARCGCSKCTERTQSIYRMVGDCANCKAGPFLILYRSGDQAAKQDCPRCGNYWTVRPHRPATDDEVPAAVPA